MRTHLYDDDPDLGRDHNGHGRCRWTFDQRRCGLPSNHPVHDVPDTHDADRQHRLRAGEKD